MNSLRTRNLQTFTVISSLWAIVLGIIGPFYVLQVQKLSGGMEKLGLAFSVMILVNSATTYITGYFSDRLGRKFFLFLIAYSEAVIYFLYTVIHTTEQLYILQALIGMTDGIATTIKTSLLGDLTVRSNRGRHVGKFNAIVTFSSGIGLAVGGYVAKFYGIKSLFYAASVIIALSSILLFFINEDFGSE